MASISATNKMAIVPLKKPFEISMIYPLQQYIKQAYTANLDDYLKSVDSLNQLRNDALFKSMRHEKLNKLMRYYDQLAAIETKLPISESQIRLNFKWQDAFDSRSIFGRSSLTLSSNLYERLCVLFNIAALCSDIASVQQIDEEDGLKTAAKYYQLAAGAFQHIRDSSLTTTRNDCTTDLYPETLSALSSVMLAQAQEIFYHKSVKDKMKDSVIAKLAAQCSDNYSTAMSIQNVDALKDAAKIWLPIIAGKQALFHALSEYHKGLHEYNEKNIGEALARLTKALEIIKVANDRGGKDLPIKNFHARIQESYDKVKKENEYVYHERVPDYKTLGPIDRAALAKTTQIKFPISDEFRDLFASMVPMTVIHGMQNFKARKMEAFNLEIGKLRQATDLLNAALSTWNLPAAIEDVSSSSKIPQSILDKSQVIKDKGGIGKINSLMTQIPNLLQINQEILNETKRLLIDEENSDNELRNQMREKWTRTPSKQLTEYLHSEIKQYEQIMATAIKANKTVEEKYEKSKDGLHLLSKPTAEISSSLPAASPVAALQNTHVIKDLKRLMNEVEGLKNVREVLESEMKSMDSDALQAKLISALQNSQGLDEHAIIQQELDELINPIRKQVRENIQEQEKLLGFIEKANNEFTRQKTYNETSQLRDEMLKNLSFASDNFNELYNHLQEGTKFYNDLTPILLKLQSKVNDFVFARKTEKDDLMKEIQTNLARPSSSAAPSRPPPPAPQVQYRNDQQQQQAPSAQGQAPPYPTNPFQQPYFPTMPNVYYPYSYYAQQPQQGQAPQYPGYPSYPSNQPPK